MRTIAIIVLLVAAAAVGYWWGQTGEANGSAVTPGQELARLDDDSTAQGAIQARPAGSAQERSENRVTEKAAAPLPPKDTPLADYYDELEARARNGDARAACRLGVELARCRQLQTQLAVQGMFELSLDHGRLHAPSDVAVDTMAVTMERNQREAAICAGVEDARFGDAVEFQRIAAERGTTRMRLWYAARPAMDRERFLDQLEEWQRYRHLAPQYLDEALRGGDPLVIGILADVHRPASSSPIPVAIPYRDPDPRMHFLYRELSDLLIPREPSPFDALEPQVPAEFDLDQLRADAEALRLRWFSTVAGGEIDPGMLHTLRTGWTPDAGEICGEAD